MPPSEGVRAGQAATIGAGVFWGTSFVTIQWGLDDGFDPVTFAGVRFLFAFSSALLVARLFGPLRTGLLRDPLVWALGLTNACGFWFQYFSLDLTTATKAALITNLSLVLVAPLSFLWLKERFNTAKVAGLVAVVPGVVLLTTNGDLSALAGSQFVGDMLALSAGMSWAFYIVISKRVLRDPEVTVMNLTLWVMGTTLVFLLPAAAFQLAVGNASLASVGGVGWAVAVYTGVCCSTVAYLLYTRGLRSVTATISAMLLLVMILVAASMDYVFQGKGLGAVAMCGAVILIVAMVLVNLSSRDQDAADAGSPTG